MIEFLIIGALIFVFLEIIKSLFKYKRPEDCDCSKQCNKCVEWRRYMQKNAPSSPGKDYIFNDWDGLWELKKNE